MWTGTLSSERRRRIGGARPRRRAARALGLLIAALVAAAPSVGAEAAGDRGGPGSAPDAAAVLDREIAALERELAGLGDAERSVSAEADRLATREALSRRRWQRAATQRDEASRLAEQERARGEALAAAAERSRARARSALREAYKQSGLAGYASVLSVSEPADLLRGFQQLDAVARRQVDAVAEHERLRVEAEESARAYRERTAALDAAAAESAHEETRLRADREARRTILDRLRVESDLQRSAIAELIRAQEDLNEAIRSLPPGSAVPTPRIAFSRLRGALPWPADGRVAVPFGPMRHPRFGTLTPHPGVDLRVAPGTTVRSVGSGRVVFSRRHGGYGRTVVVDHGERYLSVYARLAAASVEEGQDVLPGQELGFAAEGDEGGKSSVYFELRYLGKAIDPSGWLRGARGGADREGGR